MQQVGDRFGVSNSVEDSYKTAMDQMQANPGSQGLPDLRRQRPDRRRQRGGRSRQDRQGHRRRPVHPEPGTEADEVGRDHARLPVEPDRFRLCHGRARQGDGQAAGRSRTASICRAWDRARSTRTTRVIRANKQIDLNPESIDEVGQDHLIERRRAGLAASVAERRVVSPVPGPERNPSCNRP